MSPMAVLAARALIALTLASVTLLGTLALVWLLRGPWWPSMAFQLAHRRATFAPRLFWSFLIVLTVSYALVPHGGIAAGMLAWLVLAPRIVTWRGRKAAWKADRGEPELQREALAIRNRLRDRDGQNPQPGNRAWPEYVFDIERARRARRYQPPGG